MDEEGFVQFTNVSNQEYETNFDEENLDMDVEGFVNQLQITLP